MSHRVSQSIFRFCSLPATNSSSDISWVNHKIYPLKLMVPGLSSRIQRWRVASPTIFSAFALHTPAHLLIPQSSSQTLIVRFGSEPFPEHLLDKTPVLRWRLLPKNSNTQFRVNGEIDPTQIHHLFRLCLVRFRFLFVGWGTVAGVVEVLLRFILYMLSVWTGLGALQRWVWGWWAWIRDSVHCIACCIGSCCRPNCVPRWYCFCRPFGYFNLICFMGSYCFKKLVVEGY